METATDFVFLGSKITADGDCSHEIKRCLLLGRKAMIDLDSISLMDSVGEGKGGEIWENSIETCIISCMKRVASPGSMHGTGCLGLVHWDAQREDGGWRREAGSGWGTWVYLWWIHFDIWQN